MQDCAPDNCVATGTATAACQQVQPCTVATGTYKVCVGTAVVTCAGSAETNRVDCANVTGTAPTNGTCADLGGPQGPSCVLPAGTRCLYQDTLGNTLNMACGRNGSFAADMGCDYNDGCVGGMTGCTPGATPRHRCQNAARLIVDCIAYGSVYQPLSMNCTSPEWGSGICQNNACLDSTRGGTCAAGLVTCAPPLTCDSASQKCR